MPHEHSGRDVWLCWYCHFEVCSPDCPNHYGPNADLIEQARFNKRVNQKRKVWNIIGLE